MFKLPLIKNLIKYTFILQIICMCFLKAEVINKSNPEDSPETKKEFGINKSKKFMIVCADKRAAKAARNILERGGNALDAAIAAQNVLSVVEPQSSGVGGGGFLLFFNNNTNEIHAWDGREYAPMSANKDMFINSDKKKISFLEAITSPSSIGIPGLYSMLADAHKIHGKTNWKELFEEAINFTKGFRISKRLNYMLGWAPHIINDEYAQFLYFKQGVPKEVGELVINDKLNKTLLEISINPYSVNKGKIAKKIANRFNNKISLEDMNAWTTIKRESICSQYLDYDVCGFPPPTSGGVGVLQILGILENFKDYPINQRLHRSEHLFLEASRLAYNDRDAYIADPSFFNVPVKELLSKSYLNQRSKEININKANLKVKPGILKKFDNNKLTKSKSLEKSSTTHISIVDQFGHAVSLTSSIEFAFGTGKTVGGFFINNQLTDFSFASEKEDGKKIANSAEPKKKPRSSMAPTFVLKDKELHGVIGSPGGSRIICYVSKSLFYLIAYEKTLEETLKMPHFCSRNNNTEIEKDKDTYFLEKKLSGLGHNIINKKMTSGLNIIWKKNNFWYGGSDPRREGVSLGH
ncbi:MAG: gamma-glutamyltransferase [Rickettsiales bacterium]|nr:gamma-glutamyltransferase [Rickettsiales bacterium]